MTRTTDYTILVSTPFLRQKARLMHQTRKEEMKITNDMGDGLVHCGARWGQFVGFVAAHAGDNFLGLLQRTLWVISSIVAVHGAVAWVLCSARCERWPKFVAGHILGPIVVDLCRT
ncbi:hypothetical protein VNO78_00026 [Psophocarpus tetragonolobus]|uniref:Uncharacterized protein n=1 Tax=Psophocarpus tetragonolobus TaxID=3891 RepID=A0AAN9T8T8_PSOTE